MAEINQLGKQQVFEWGSIRWFVEPDNLDVERMSVGLVTFKPNTIQEEHLHFGYEQVVYVVSGNGKQIIDGVVFSLTPGEVRHMSPYTRHKVFNDSAEELTLLIVYTPSKFQRLLSQPVEAAGVGDGNDIRTFLDLESIAGLLNRLSEALGLSLAILDTGGEFIVKTDNYSDFCCLLQTASGGSHCRQRIQKAFTEIADISKPHLFLCCNDIASIIIPILSGKSVKGYIKCGEVFLTKPDRELRQLSLDKLAAAYRLPADKLWANVSAIKTEPKSRLYAAAEATFAIANCIAEMTSTAIRQKELDNSRLSLIKEQMATTKLEKALQEADLKLLQSQINPHFLFNTLNMIAQLAYNDGTEKVAKLVWDLADLLRFTLHKPEQLIPLGEELKLLNSFLHIQQSRFGKRLTIRMDIEPGLAEVLIPGMLLQPLLENAIIHGIELHTQPGLIQVTVKRQGDKLYCRIEDNGIGFDAEDAAGKRQGIGISSVKNRLKYYYDEYDFVIASQPGKGTVVELAFPVGGTRHAGY